MPVLNQEQFPQEASAAILGAPQRGVIPLIIRYQGNIDCFSSLSRVICCFPHFKHPKSREERDEFSPEVGNLFHMHELFLLLLFTKGDGQQLAGRQCFGNNFIILSVLVFQKFPQLNSHKQQMNVLSSLPLD